MEKCASDKNSHTVVPAERQAGSVVNHWGGSFPSQADL